MIKSSSNHWGIQFYGQCGIIVGGMHVPVPGVEQHIHLSLLETCTGQQRQSPRSARPMVWSSPKANQKYVTRVPAGYPGPRVGLAIPKQSKMADQWLIITDVHPRKSPNGPNGWDPNGPDSGAADACRSIIPGNKKLGNLVWHQHVDLCYVLWWIRWRYLIYVRLW